MQRSFAIPFGNGLKVHNPLASKTLPWEIGVARRSFVASVTIPVVLSTAAYNALAEAIDTYWDTWREVYSPRGNPRPL